MMKRGGPLALAFGFLASLAGASPHVGQKADDIAMRLGVAWGGQRGCR